MRFFIILTILFSPLVSWNNPVSAATLKVNTKPGKPVVVAFYGTYSEATCQPTALPQYRVSKKPKHGSLRHEIHASKIQRKGPCQGKPIKGHVVIYTPNKGFRGKDSGQVSFSYFRYTEGAATKHVAAKFVVTVK